MTLSVTDRSRWRRGDEAFWHVGYPPYWSILLTSRNRNRAASVISPHSMERWFTAKILEVVEAVRRTQNRTVSKIEQRG
jgi:hypothetical protein